MARDRDARPASTSVIGFDMGGTSTDVVPFRRRVRARLRDRGRRRAHARADDAHPHGRGRRRLDPALRRRALPRRAGIGRRQSRARLLSPRRAARRHRRQRDGRQAAARRSSRRSSAPDARPAARRRGGARRLRRARRRDRRRPQRRRRSPTASSASRSRTWRTRSRRSRSQRGYDVTDYALQLLRRRRRPARLPRRRHARHEDGAASIRFPACSRPTAWASPTSAPRAQQAVEAPLDAATLGARASARARRSATTPSREVAAQGVADARHRHRRPRCICATTAPTRRSPIASRAGDGSHAMRAARFEAAHRARFGFVDRAASRSSSRRSRSRRSAAAPSVARARACRCRRGDAAAGRARRASSPTAPGTTRAVFLRERLAPGARDRRARRSSSSRTRPSSSSRAGRPRSRRKNHLVLTPRRRAAAAHARSAPRPIR